jgi:GTPase SAR1 family protein
MGVTFSQGGRGLDASPTKVLVIGSEGVGKTLLLRQLANCASKGKPGDIESATIPSVGTELHQIRVAKCNLLCREMGGSMIPVWPRYFDECHAVVFAVDNSSEEQLASATIELLTALQSPALDRKPLALVLNKCDAPMQIPPIMLESVMRIDDVILSERAERDFICIRCSAMTAQGVPDLLHWLAKQAQALAVARNVSAGAHAANAGQAQV